MPPGSPSTRIMQIMSTTPIAEVIAEFSAWVCSFRIAGRLPFRSARSPTRFSVVSTHHLDTVFSRAPVTGSVMGRSDVCMSTQE